MSEIADLIDAVKNNNTALVRMMIDANSKLVNQHDESGATALH